jgi:hypothetical protein
MNFPSVYVISMPNSPRVNVIKSQLTELRIDFMIQEAIDGSKLSEESINELVDLKSCDARLGFRISKNLIGSGLSHRAVHKRAFDSNSDWALILEEDVSITNFNKEIIFSIIVNLDNSPTVVQLFTRASRMMRRSSVVELSSSVVMYDFYNRIVGCGAQAYLINRKALKLALASKKLNGAPDWPPWSQDCKFLGIYPWLFHETAEGSTVPLPKIHKYTYLLRRLTELTGLHYIYYRKEYGSLKRYIGEEIVPYITHLFWKITGSRHYKNDSRGPQII